MSAPTQDFLARLREAKSAHEILEVLTSLHSEGLTQAEVNEIIHHGSLEMISLGDSKSTQELLLNLLLPTLRNVPESLNNAKDSAAWFDLGEDLRRLLQALSLTDSAFLRDEIVGEVLSWLTRNSVHAACYV